MNGGWERRRTSSDKARYLKQTNIHKQPQQALSHQQPKRMTEESDNQQLNLIEYEEFAQSEQSTNPNIPEASLPNCCQSNYDQINNCDDYEDNGSDTERNPNNCSTEREHKDVYRKSSENERKTNDNRKKEFEFLQNTKQVEEFGNLTANSFTNEKEIKKQADTFEVIPDSMDQEYLLKPPSKSRLAIPSRIEQANNTFHETVPIRQEVQTTQDQLMAPNNASPMKQTREELLEEKIIHMDIIIQAQREQMAKKEEKITFLLKQISDLNTHISEKTSETSSIKVEFAKIQNEIEYLKQQQRIQNEIHSGESNIIDVQIKQEEQLIEQVNMKLSGTSISQQLPLGSPSQAVGAKTDNRNSKKQFDDLLTASYQAESSLAYPISQANSMSSKITFRDPLPKQPYWTTANFSTGQDNKSQTNQIQPSQPSQQSDQKQFQERETEGQHQAQEQKPSSQINNQHLKTNIGHSKNAMSHDFVYKRDLVLQSFHQDQPGNSPANQQQQQQQQQQYLEQQSTPVGSWSKYPFYNCLSAGASQKRSSSNHTASSYVPLSCKNATGAPLLSILSNKENRTKEFFDKSNSQPATQSSYSVKNPLAKSTDPQKKSESYREQYIKNIEELQQRLEFLKQKRVEYEIKPENALNSQSTRIDSNLQKMYKEKGTNQPAHSLSQSQFCMQKLHQFSTGQSIPENNNNNKNNNSSFLLGRGSNSQRQSENTLLHFAQFKKSDPINKESYFDKQQFQASNFAPSTNYILGSTADENYPTLKPTSALFDNYIGNTHSNSNNTNTLLSSIDKTYPKKNQGFKNSQVSETTLLSGKQYFPVSSKHKFRNNEFSLQDAAFMPERDSVSPLKVQSTRNSSNNYKPLTEGLLLSASLKSKQHSNLSSNWI